MSAFLCEHCGAALEIPEDDDAMDAECAFCNKHTPLPHEILVLRARPVPPPPAARAPEPRVSPLWVFAALGVVVLAGVVSFVRVALRPSPPRVTPSPSIIVDASPSAPPRRALDLTDRSVNGADAVSERVRQLHDRGCKDVILAPAQASGEHTLDTKLVKNGRCVNVIAMTGAPDNLLTLTMNTPLGVAVEAPPPATSVELQVCPKMSGQHPTTIVPRTDAPYTVAAIECPAAPKKVVH